MKQDYFSKDCKTFTKNPITVSEQNNETENSKILKINKKYQPKLTLLIIQIFVCLTILTCATILKNFGGIYFEYVKQWYNEKINDSLIVENNIKDYQNLVNKKFSENTKFLSTSNSEIQNISLSINLFNPLKDGKITSKFGKRQDPITGKESIHSGLDIGTSGGNPIYAVMSGTVTKAEKIGGYGNCIIINHGNSIETLYAHCKSLEVSPGSKVSRGQKVASVGSTGRSTGNHLHFEILIHGKKVNPEKFLNGVYL